MIKKYQPIFNNYKRIFKNNQKLTINKDQEMNNQ